MRVGKCLIFVTVLCFPFILKSQDTKSEKNENCDRFGCPQSWSFLSSVDLTYTGYSTVLALEYEKNKISFYAGPKISLTQTYIPGRGPWGGNSGFRYLFLTNHDRWRFFFNVDYQLAFYSAFKQAGEKGSKKNFIHELNFGYGVRFKISERLYVAQSIGMGKYFESYYSYKTDTRARYSGYDALLRLVVKYKFS